LLLPKGDGTFYKIPVPRELGPIFHGGVTRTLRAWVDKDPKAFEGFADKFLLTFYLQLERLLLHVSDLRSNKNFHGCSNCAG
jgi:hypothetical protein